MTRYGTTSPVAAALVRVYLLARGDCAMNEGSGGLAVISVELSSWLLLVVLAIVVVAGIKLWKFLWLMFK